jgi:hypothetical protein
MKIGHSGGVGPTRDEALVYAGHAAISLDSGRTKWGFNPSNPAALSMKRFLNRLKAGEAFPGQVLDDASAFQLARRHRLPIRKITLLVPGFEFRRIQNELALEQNRSKYKYGFPDGDGDCNCVTWIEKMGIPLATGKMDEFELTSGKGLRRRRFGRCK